MAYAATGAALVVILLNLVGAGRIGLFFDLSFVVVCVAAALAIRPSEFFVAGVLPPLLMTGTVATLAIVDRSAVAEPDDSFVQAIVSGLAHHVIALVLGYFLTLGILGLRQVALRNSGSLRKAQPVQRVAPPPRSMPAQREHTDQPRIVS